MTLRPATVGVAFVAVLIMAWSGDASGQERPAGDATPQAPPGRLAVSPGGAFLRAVLLPGWGHASIGSYTRGGFYFAAQSATLFTFARTRVRINDAQSRIDFRETTLRAQLATEGVSDPLEIEDRLAQDPALTELTGLLDSRKDQQEDMIALGIFFMFISGADAYVSAHLARFPEPLELEAQPVGDGRVEVGFRVRLHN